jgi:hypothetical protein
MKPESAKRIIDAYFDVFDDLSIRTFNQGLAFVLDGLEARLSYRDGESLRSQI